MRENWGKGAVFLFAGLHPVLWHKDVGWNSESGSVFDTKLYAISPVLSVGRC